MPLNELSLNLLEKICEFSNDRVGVDGKVQGIKIYGSTS